MLRTRGLSHTRTAECEGCFTQDSALQVLLLTELHWFLLCSTTKWRIPAAKPICRPSPKLSVKDRIWLYTYELHGIMHV